MTSTVSNNMAVPAKTKKYSPALHYWKNGVKSHSRLMMILTILHLAAAPPVLLSLIICLYAGSYDTDTFAEIFSVIGGVTTALAGFLGIFIAIGSFNCLHKRSVVDMKLSLPLTSTQRFFADFLSGLFAYLVPFLAVDIISLLLAGYGLNFMEGKTFYHTLTAPDGTVTSIPFECKYFADLMPVLLKLILAGILTMLMLYTITVLITVCCGSIFESITYTILINVIIPATIYLMSYIIYAGLYGMEMGHSRLNIISVTSVAGGLYYLGEWLSGYMEYSGFFQPWLWATLYFLVTVAFGAIAFFLYRKRRAEQVSRPFVFKLAYYIIITCAMLCIYASFYLSETNMVAMVIVTAVCYMISEVVTNRGFRRFWLSIIKYAATMLGAVVIVFAGHRSEGFGAVQRVPSASSVSSVTLAYKGFYADLGGYTTFIEPENIQTIIDAHSAIIKNYREHKEEYIEDGKYGSFRENTYASDVYISISYDMKNGSTIERNYNFLNWEAAEILGRIDLTDEFKTQMAEQRKAGILEISSLIADELADGSAEYHDRHVNCHVYSMGRMFGDVNIIEPAVLYKRGFFEQFAAAYADDIMAITEENYYRSQLKNVYHVYLTTITDQQSMSFEVPESFANTVGVLERFGFDLMHVEDLTDEELYPFIANTIGFGYLSLFDENQWREMNNIPEGEVLHSMYGSYPPFPSDDDRVYLYTIDGNICDLIRAAMPRNIVGRGCYTIRVFDRSAAIPPELTALAEEVSSERTERDDDAASQYREIAEQEFANKAEP